MALAFVVQTGACGTTATIHRKWDLPVEGKIVGGSPDHIYLRDSGGLASVMREDIADIDHPGTPLIVAGVLASIAAAGYTVRWLPGCDEQGAGACVALFIPAAFTLALFGWGVKTYNDSASAAKDKSRAEPDAPRRRPPPKSLPAAAGASPADPTEQGDASQPTTE